MASSNNADSEGLAEDTWTDERILIRIAHRVFAQHLDRFASISLGIRPAEFSHIESDAGPSALGKCQRVSKF